MVSFEKRMAYDGSGLKDFFWLISANEIVEVRDALTCALGKKIFLEKDFAVMVPCFSYIIRHIIELWQARKLIEQGLIHQEGGGKSYPMYETSFGRGYSGVKPLVLKRLEDPAEGKGKAKGLYKIGLGWAYELRLNYLQKNKSLERLIACYANGGKSVVYAGNDITREYVAKRKIDARYESPLKWFYQAKKKEKISACTASKEKWHELIAIVQDVFSSHSTLFGDEEYEYILSLLISIEIEVSTYYAHLKEKKLPETLLTGTGGNVFSAILSKVVIDNGGEVIRFDHSMGQGFAVRPGAPLIDYPSASKVVTTNENKMLSLLRAYKKYGFDHFLDKPVHEVYRPETIGPALWSKENGRDGTIRKVMYVPTVYSGDQIWFEPHTPAMIMLDWQIRLLSWLKRAGYEVMVKPHPGSKIEFPKWLASDLELVVCNDNFENVVDQADLFLFDKIQTTTFLTALKTKTPIVYAQIDQWDWMPGARADLKKRVGLLETYVDSDNRIHFDSDSLAYIISECMDLVENNDFYCNYVA